jgi:hypothetical protein
MLNKKNVNEALRQTTMLKITKLVSGSLFGLKKMGVKASRKSQPPPKLKKGLLAA